jgi:hypothetical protein
MGPFVLAKLDITSKTQKVWSDTLMIALYYNRARHNILQTWVCGPAPLTEKVEQLSSSAPILSLSDLMNDRSLVVQINYLYQNIMCDLDAKTVMSISQLSTYYSTPPTYKGSVYKLDIGRYPPTPGYEWPVDDYGNYPIDEDGVVNPSYIYALDVPFYTTRITMPAVINQPDNSDGIFDT